MRPGPDTSICDQGSLYMLMIPLLTVIDNLLLETVVMPLNMKDAMIKPILKKPHLDKDTLMCPICLLF